MFFSGCMPRSPRNFFKRKLHLWTFGIPTPTPGAIFTTPWTVARQAPLSMGFSRHKYWSGLPSPLPGDRPDPGIEPRCPELQAGSLPSEPPGKPAKSQNPAKSQPYTCCDPPLSFLLLSLLRERDANTWVLHTDAGRNHTAQQPRQQGGAWQILCEGLLGGQSFKNKS